MLNKYIKIVFFIIVIILISIIGFLSYRLSLVPQNTQQIMVEEKAVSFVSPHIISLTAPVMSLSGRIEKIQGNVLTVSLTFNKNGLYQIRVDNKTPLFKRTSSIFPSPLSKTTTLESAPILFKDFKINDYVTVNSDKDLRLLAEPLFNATFIMLEYPSTWINGTIVEITQKDITVNGKLAMAGQINPGTKEQFKNFRLPLTDDVEVVSLSPVSQLSFSDLKKDMQINVYLTYDPRTEKIIKVYRIDLLPVIAKQ